MKQTHTSYKLISNIVKSFRSIYHIIAFLEDRDSLHSETGSSHNLDKEIGGKKDTHLSTLLSLET